MVQQIEALIEKSRTASMENPEAAISFAREGMILCDNSNDPEANKLMGHLAYELGCATYYAGNISGCIKPFNQAATSAETNKNDLLYADAKLMLGFASSDMGDTSTAISHYEKALEKQKNLGEKTRCATTLHSIAGEQIHLKQFNVSLPLLKQCLEICQNDEETLYNLYPQVLITYGVWYKEQQKYKEALEKMEEGLSVGQRLNVIMGTANALCEMGQVLHCLKSYKSAQTTLEESISQFQKQGNPLLVSIAKLYLGQVQADPQSPFYNPDKAIATFMDTLETATACKAEDWIFKSHHALAEVLESKGDNEGSLYHYKRYMEIRAQQLTSQSQLRYEQLIILHSLEEEKQKKEIHRLKNVELASVNEKLTKLLGEKEEFLGFAAHDIKSPLAGVIGLTNLLKEFDMLEKDPELDKIVTMVHTSARSALDIVTKLLEFYRLEESSVEIKPTFSNLYDSFNELFEEYAEQANAKGINFVVEDSSNNQTFYADSFMIGQILENLFSNAIKYSYSDTTIIVRAQLGLGPEPFKIQVIDQGPGIPEEEMHLLFKRFAKISNNPTGDESTTGLGLAIVKKLADLNNAQVFCESEAGVGSTFNLNLPTLKKEPEGVHSPDS